MHLLDLLMLVPRSYNWFMYVFFMLLVLVYSLWMICTLLLVQLLKELPFLLFCSERYQNGHFLFSYQSSMVAFLSSTCSCFQSKNALLSTFLFLDQIVWLGRTGIYKVRRFLSSISMLYLWISTLESGFLCVMSTNRIRNALIVLEGFLCSVGWARHSVPC